MAENPLIPVQLRLPPEKIDELKATGRAAERSLPQEIRHRLDAYLMTGGMAEAMGNLAALIVRRAEQYTSDPGQVLGLVRAAMGAVIAELDVAAHGPEIDGESIASAIALDLAHQIKSPAPPGGLFASPASDVARKIGAALGVNQPAPASNRKIKGRGNNRDGQAT